MCRLKEIYSCLSGGWNNKMSIYCNMLDVDTGTNYQCRKNTKCRDRFRDLRWNSRTNSWVEVSGHNLESS